MRKSKKIKYMLLTSTVFAISAGVCININNNLKLLNNKLLSEVKLEKSVVDIEKARIMNEISGKSEVEKELLMIQKEGENDIEIPVLEEVEPVSYIENVTKEGSGATDELVELVDNKLKMIPGKVVEKYFDGGGKLILTDADIAKVYYKDTSLGRIAGLHDANRNVVYISARENAIDSALIHEFGHVLDYLVDWASWKDDFIEIFEEEKHTFEVESTDGHYKRNEREFFAEVFQELILNPERCRRTAPKTSVFVEEKLNSLK